MQMSPDGKFLAVASHDKYIRTYNCDGWSLISSVKEHNSAVVMMDWSSDSRYLRSNSLDWELLYWQVNEIGVMTLAKASSMEE